VLRATWSSSRCYSTTALGTYVKPLPASTAGTAQGTSHASGCSRPKRTSTDRRTGRAATHDTSRCEGLCAEVRPASTVMRWVHHHQPTLRWSLRFSQLAHQGFELGLLFHKFGVLDSTPVKTTNAPGRIQEDSNSSSLCKTALANMSRPSQFAADPRPMWTGKHCSPYLLKSIMCEQHGEHSDNKQGRSRDVIDIRRQPRR